MVVLDERITITGISADDEATINGLLQQLKDKTPRNLLRSSYYDGRRAINQIGSVIPPHYYRMGLVLGWSGKAVDILARRCNLDRFVWPDGDLDSLGAREVFDRNNLRSEVSSGVISSLLYGPAFLVNTRGVESAGEPRALIHVKDATAATGTWNSRKRGLDNLLSVTGRDDEGKVTALALYLDGRTITAERLAGGQWRGSEERHPWGMPVEPMPYKPRVGRPFGMSRISRILMSLHDSGLRTVIRLEGHMDVYSFPEMWMLGADESIFKNPDGTQKATFNVMLGRLKGIPDDEDATQPRADVKQFSASSPEPQLAALNAQAKLFAREAALPDTSLAITDVSNPTSAESYDASQHEIIAEAEGAMDDWGPALRRSQVRALAMMNGIPVRDLPSEWSTIAEKWRSPRYLSRAAEADAGMKMISAVPWLAETEVGLEKLGLSEQEIDRALAERRRNGGSAALRAITEAAAAGRPVVTPDAGDASA